MGRNSTLGLLAISLCGLAIWAIASGGSQPEGVLRDSSEIAHDSEDLRSRELSLPPPNEVVVLSVDPGAEDARHEVQATDPAQGMVDLDMILVDLMGEPTPGAKLRLHLSSGEVLTRWSSQAGALTLYGIPVGEFSASAPGYRIAFPNVDEPTLITGDGVLQVQAAGMHEVRGSIYSDTKDEGEIRLYRTLRIEQLSSSQDAAEKASRDLARQDLFSRLMGANQPPMEGRPPFDPRTFREAPEGQLITSLTERRFPGNFRFTGLEPGSYQVVVHSRHHTKRILRFEVKELLTLVELDISDGHQILVAVQLSSGKLPSRPMVRLLDQYATDLPRRTLESSQDTHSGRWTFSDLEAGTWFVEVRPGPRTIGRQFPVEAPTHSPDVPVLDLVIDDARETKLQVTFQSGQEIVFHGEDRLIAVFRGPGGQFLGERSLGLGGVKAPANGEFIELAVGPLFPGEYDVYLYPDPSAASFRVVHSEGQTPRYINDYSADWVGPFEAKRLPLKLGVGTEPATFEISLDWYRSPSAKPVDPAGLLLGGSR